MYYVPEILGSPVIYYSVDNNGQFYDKRRRKSLHVWVLTLCQAAAKGFTCIYYSTCVGEEPSLKGLKNITQGHQAAKRQSQDLKPNLFDLELVLLTITAIIW